MPPSFLTEVLTNQEIADLGLATAPEDFQPPRRLPWKSFKAARAYFLTYSVLELLLEYWFLDSCLLQWQRIPIMLAWPAPLRSLIYAVAISLTISVCEVCILVKTDIPFTIGLWEIECLLSTVLTFTARLLDISFCVSLLVDGGRPALTLVATSIILCVSLIPRFLAGLILLCLLFSASNATLVRLFSGDVSEHLSCDSLSPLFKLTRLMRRPLSEDMAKISITFRTHPASLQVSWLRLWASVIESLHKLRRTRPQCTPPWRRPPVWDAPELLLSVSDVSAGAVEMVERSASSQPVQETSLDPTQPLASKIRRGLQHLDHCYAVSDFKIMQLAATANLFDHYLLGHLLSESYLARDLQEELNFMTSIGIFVWCHLTVLVLNLIKFHTLMSTADEQLAWLPLISLVASLMAACNAFFLHTFDQQLMADLMDDD